MIDWSRWMCSPRNYWKLGPFYVWKWLCLGLLAVGSVTILTIFGPPKHLWHPPEQTIPTYQFSDPALLDVTGMVQILDHQHRLRYLGEVVQGACTGIGQVYDPSGQLVYEGPLVDGVFEGENAKVYTDGVLIYEGAMSNNQYQGQGRSIDPSTGIISQGEFVAGVLEGSATQISTDGTLLRSGTFSNNLLEGAGEEYNDDGSLLRCGTFSQGLLHGTGAEYSTDGKRIYEGEFQFGTYHGQGKLYDPLTQALLYQGEFFQGQPSGVGGIYHSSGQLLYQGVVEQSQPRADAFLGLSLAELEGAFQEHWLLYSFQDVTAFVYPTFHLMFITQTPIQLHSPTQQDALTHQQRQELLDALKPADSSGSPVPSPSFTPTFDDWELSPETVKNDIIVSEVLSYGAALSGIAQPDSLLPSGQREIGWREWFCDFASGATTSGFTVVQAGSFVYQFTRCSPSIQMTDYYLATGSGVESTTVLRKEKDNPIWYQSAVRRDENP